MADVGKRSWTPGSRYLKIVYNVDDNTTKFNDNYKTYVGDSLFLTESPQITATSQFGEAISHGDGIGKLKLLYELAAGTNFDKLDYTGFQVWQGSSPMKIRVNAKFFLGMRGKYSGREEVYNPIAFLTSLVLPLQTGVQLMSPSPNYWVAMTRLIQANGAMASQLTEIIGNTLGTFLGSGAIKRAGENGAYLVDNITNELGKLAAKRQQFRGVYKILMGKNSGTGDNSLIFPNMIITECQPVFSTEVDDDGFPIYGTVQMEFSSLFSANSKSIPLIDEQRQRFALSDGQDVVQNQNFLDEKTLTTDVAIAEKAKKREDDLDRYRRANEGQRPVGFNGE